MRVLAIDTALEACSAAVFDTDHGGITASESVAMARGHAEAVMPLLARVMDLAEIDFANLDRIAVTTGPGSFTGLRVGIAAARGIALAAGKPAIGLSTLAAFATPLIAEDDTTHVVAAIDARHDNVYLQVFGIGGRTLVAPRVATIRDAVRAAITGPVRIIGSAARQVAAAWPKGAEPPLQVEHRSAPDIDWVARLGAAAAEGYGPPKPLYLRAPDAQPQDAARLPRRCSLLSPVFSHAASPLCRKPRRRTPARSRAFTPPRSIGDGAMGSSNICCSTAMSSRIARWWDVALWGSSCRGACWRKPRSSRSPSQPPAAARDCRANCSICICAVSRVSAHARFSSKWTKATSRRAGFIDLPASVKSDGGRAIIPPARVPPR